MKLTKRRFSSNSVSLKEGEKVTVLSCAGRKALGGLWAVSDFALQMLEAQVMPCEATIEVAYEKEPKYGIRFDNGYFACLTTSDLEH